MTWLRIHHGFLMQAAGILSRHLHVQLKRAYKNSTHSIAAQSALPLHIQQLFLPWWQKL